MSDFRDEKEHISDIRPGYGDIAEDYPGDYLGLPPGLPAPKPAPKPRVASPRVASPRVASPRVPASPVSFQYPPSIREPAELGLIGRETVMYDEEGHPSYADFALPGFFDSREEALRQVEVASRMNRDARKRRKHRDEYLNWKSDFLTKREQLIQQTDARDPDLGNIPCQNRKTEAECVGGVLGGECKWSPYKRYWHGILPEFLGGDWQCQPSDIVDDFIDTVCAPKTFGWLTPVEIRDTCIMLGYKLSDFNTQDWAEVTKSMVCEKLRSNLKILRRSDILFFCGLV